MRRLPDWSTGPGRCSADEAPAFERIIFRDDSTYSATGAERPGCRIEGERPSDTLRWSGLYRTRGDTLTLYSAVAEGWEEAFNGRVGPGVVEQIAVDLHARRIYARLTAPHPLELPRRLVGACEGEDCQYGYAVVACADLALRSGDSAGAPVVGWIAKGDTATVVTGNLWVLAPGVVVLRRDYVLASDEGEEGPIPRVDTLRFQAGDTVYVLEYGQLGEWEWWYKGRLSGGQEFWDGPSQRAFRAGAEALPGHSLSVSHREYWLQLRASGGTQGWWREIEHATALVQEGEHCSP